MIDSIGQYQDILINEIKKPVLTQRDWGNVASSMKTLITKFTKLPVNTVMIAHDRTFRIETEDDDADLPGQNITMPEVGPAVMPSVSKILNANAGVLGNTFIMETHEKIKTKIAGKSVIKKRRIVKYCIRLGPHAIYRSKVRKPLGIEVPEWIDNPTYDKLIQIKQGKYK